MKNCFLLFGVISLLFFSSPSFSQEYSNPDNKLKVLHEIRIFASQFCQEIPLEGKSEGVMLKGKAEAAAKGFVKKIAGLGIKGDARYSTEEYEGLVRDQLMKAIEDSRECRMVLWSDLMPIFFPIQKKKTE